MPIYNKDLFIRYPFPLTLTFFQMFLSIPFAFIIAWMSQGCILSFSWLVPPLHSIPYIVLNSFLYGGMMFTGNLGFYVSDLDFAVLFRITTIISTSLLGLIFLHGTPAQAGGGASVRTSIAL